MKTKGFLGILLLVVGCWLLVVGFSFAENCEKEVAKTYVKRGNNFIEISAINSLTCPMELEKTKLPFNISFTEKEKERAAKIMPLVTMLAKLPGECKTIEECEAYCFADIEHIEECLVFAEKHKILSFGELKEAKKVVQVLKKSNGFGPPNCPDARKM